MQGFTRHAVIAFAAFTLLLQWVDVLAATTYIWPGAAPCNTAALQDCINAASNGDTVQVLSNGPIDEDLSISKPLTLIAAPGYRPVFAAGRGIDAVYNPGSSTNWSVTIDNFTLLDGSVSARGFGGNPTFTLRRLDITTTGASSVGIFGLTAQNYGTGSMKYLIEQNRVRLNDTISLNGIQIDSSSTGSFDGTIRDNRVESLSTAASDAAISITGTQASAPNVLIYGNQLTGNLYNGIWFWTGGTSNLFLISNLFSTRTTDYSFGGELTLSTGAHLTLSAFNNTIAGFKEGVVATGPMTGRFSGNLFAYDTGFSIHSQNASVTEDHSLFFNSALPATLGMGSLNADPKFRRGVDDMRLTSGSPAIDAADSAALSTLLSTSSLPAIDADGLRRFKGATNAADIGAFEFGDGSLIEFVGTDAGVIDNTQLNGNVSALPQLVATASPDTYHAAFAPILTGLDYVSSRFGVVNETAGSAPTSGSAYNVFVPGTGNGAFMHTTSALNVAGFTTFLDNAYVNGHPERIVLASHRATPLFDHGYGLVYAFGSWFIQEFGVVSGDPDFATGQNFHIYAQDPSLNAFIWTAPAAGTATAIDHVLLNGEPCGRIYVGNGNLDPHPIGVKYSNQRWSIVNLDNQAMSAGAEFFVVIDEAATQFCRYDHVFHDGFDGG